MGKVSVHIMVQISYLAKWKPGLKTWVIINSVLPLSKIWVIWVKPEYLIMDNVLPLSKIWVKPEYWIIDSVCCRQEARLAAPATKLTGRLSRSLPLGGVCPTSFYQFIFFSFWVTGRAQVLADLGSLGSSLSRSLISWWCMSNWLVAQLICISDISIC